MRNLTYYTKLLGSLFVSTKNYQRFLRFDKKQLLIFLVISSIGIGSVWGVKTIYYHVVPFEQATRQAAEEFIAYYPDNLVVSWDGSQLVLEPNEQYTVYYPSFVTDPTFRQTFSELSLPDTIASFVPGEVSLEDLQANHDTAFFVITPSKIHVQSTNQEWRTYMLSELIVENSFSASKQDVTQVITNSYLFSNSFWNTARLLFLFLSPIVVLLGLVWNTTIQWLLAFLVVKQLYRVALSGKELAKLSLPIVVIATAIQVTAEAIYQSVTLPLFSIGYWLLLFLVIRSVLAKAKQ